MGRPNDAFSLMRKLGNGITNANLNKIQIANEGLGGQDSDGDGLSAAVEDSIGTDKNNLDSDGDGYDDKDEIINGYNPKGTGKLPMDNNFTRQQTGKILLQVESKGEAWYINPEDNKRYFLGRPVDAFNLMRKLGLGITINDLNKITINPINSQVQKTNAEDCGSFDSTHIFIAPPLTDQDKTSLNCFNKAANGCNSSLIKSEGGIYGSFAYEILDKNGDTCNISFKTINSPTAPDSLHVDYFSVCSLPMDGFIVPMLQEMEKQNNDTSSTELIFLLGFSFIKGSDAKAGSDGWYENKITDTRTNKPINFKCK
jgi:hypothetical protein